MSANPRANVFILVNLGCEALYVIDQRLKAQQIASDKSVQGELPAGTPSLFFTVIIPFPLSVIHDVTTVLLDPKFLESLINGSMHSKAQLLTVEHCKFMLNDIATCSLMRLDETSMEKLWNLMTMVYKWQLFVSRHQHNLLDITFRHLDAINKLYPDARRHMLIDFAKNMLLDFWNACGEEQQLSIYRTNKAWLQCFNTKISLLIRLGFQSMDGSFINALELPHYLDFAKCIGNNIYMQSGEFTEQQQQQQREPNRMDQLAAQLNITQTTQHPAGEDLQPIDAGNFQKQLEQTFSHTLFADFADNNVEGNAARTATQPMSQSQQRSPNASGCEFVQLLAANTDSAVRGGGGGGGSNGGGGAVLNRQLLDLYSKMS